VKNFKVNPFGKGERYMVLNINKVMDNNIGELIKYASAFGAEHDGSYLPGRDFDLSEETPSYLLMNNDEVVGAVSLMRTKRYLSVNQARFSIFHTILNTVEAYAKLLDAIQPHNQDLDKSFLFIPEKNKEIALILKELGFEVERYSFILESRDSQTPEPVFPEGISVYPLDPSDQAGIIQFVDCLNQEFKDLAGHTTNTTDDLKTWFEDQSYLEGGLCLLKKNQEPIGTIAMMRDLDDMGAGEILAFGILEEYRGKNLGRNLLRYGTNFLSGKALNPVILSVNGENHGAINLYQKEGFNLTESVICYSLKA
jgi:mycothiol synthase